MGKNRRFMFVGGIALLLIVIAFMLLSKGETPDEQATPAVKSELRIKGLLYHDPRDGQLTLYERWEEPYYGVAYLVTGSPKLDFAPFMNHIVLMQANGGKSDTGEKNQERITAVGIKVVETLTEKEYARWIRFLILNDLDRTLAQQQAKQFITQYPKSDYIPDTYKYVSQLHLYNAAFQQAVNILSEFINKYPDNGFFVDKFKREIRRIEQTYLIHPAYGKFIVNQGDWQLLSADELIKHVPTLLQALDEVKADADKGVDRSTMIKLLARSGSKEAIAFLLDYQQQASKSDRLSVSKYMQAHIDKKAVKQYYIKALNSNSASIKLQAAQVLGGANSGPEVIKLLIKALADHDARVVGASAFALGKIGAKKAIAPLEKLTDSPNPMISSSANIALKKIRKK